MIGQLAIIGALVMLLIIFIVWRSNKKAKRVLKDLLLTSSLEGLKLLLASIR